jgi:arginine repressor
MKKMRQKAILDLVRSREISSQEELLENLLARKIDVSQSTLSATFRSWDWQNRRHRHGWRSAPCLRRFGALDTARISARGFRSSEHSCHKDGPGERSIVARAIDTAGWKEVVGNILKTTVFVVLRPAKESRN